MIDLAVLNAAIGDLTTQVAETVGTEDSARVLIEGFAEAVTKAVTDALTKDAAANAESITAAAQAIAAVKNQFHASASALGTAVAANQAPAPEPPAQPTV